MTAQNCLLGCSASSGSRMQLGAFILAHRQADEEGATMQLTDRQREIKTRLDDGEGAREIAEALGITRNAVYQSIQRMRRDGVLPKDWTPTGLPARETAAPGADVLQRLLTDDGLGEAEIVHRTGVAALVAELRRTRNELDAIARRLSEIVPR